MLFSFLGRILGKSLYEGITISPQFSHFFLSFLRGDYNYFHMLPDLSSVDAQLYNNLMFLKTYDGDAEDLALTFTVANDDFGGNKQIDLIPNGANISVTNANKQRYIGKHEYNAENCLIFLPRLNLMVWRDVSFSRFGRKVLCCGPRKRTIRGFYSRFVGCD